MLIQLCHLIQQKSLSSGQSGFKIGPFYYPSYPRKLPTGVTTGCGGRAAHALRFRVSERGGRAVRRRRGLCLCSQQQFPQRGRRGRVGESETAPWNGTRGRGEEPGRTRSRRSSPIYSGSAHGPSRSARWCFISIGVI